MSPSIANNGCRPRARQACLAGLARKRFGRLVALFVFVLLPRSSVARADEQFFTLDYRAPAGCPSWPRFVTEVTLRTPRVRLGEDRRHRAIGVDVDIADERTHATGHLVLRETDGRHAVRKVDGADCAEVTSALALVAALALDPNASTQPVVLAASLPASHVPAPAMASPSTAPTRDTAKNVQEPARSFDWHVSAGAEIALSHGAAPSVLPIGEVFVGASRAEGAWSWDTRVGLAYAAPTSADVPLGRAEFGLVFARADECPWTARWARQFAASPCVSFEAGRLHAEGIAGPVIVAPNQATVWWMAAGVRARLDWNLGDVWFAEAGFGTLFPLFRESFVFAVPGGLTEAHKASPVVGEAGVGWGAHFR
jgi:hypothetical protein